MPPVTNPALDVTKLDLGPVQVFYNGVDLGGTLDNATIKFKYDKAEMKVDQLGSTVVDRRVSGMMATVETALAEVLEKAKFKVAFPNMDLVATGTKLVRMANKMGVSDYAQAAILRLHPINRAPADLTADWTFAKAVASEDSEFTNSPEEQKKLKAIWNIYPDFGVSGYPLFIHGDPAIGLINASAAAAVAGGGNTGNGTVGSITAYNGFTKTETITLTCVGVPGANQANFSVSGSVSGPLGIATVGVAFISNPISFTIADGTTDFVIGDSFTIATTAANYV